MLRFIRYKIANKKWLNFCLLTGVILLSAFLCIYPMFREGSLDKLIYTLMTDYTEEKSEYPAVMTKSSRIFGNDSNNMEYFNNLFNGYESTWTDYIDCDIVTAQEILKIAPGYCDDYINEKPKQVYLYCFPGMFDHVDVVYGVSPDKASESENPLVIDALIKGAVPCVISEEDMDEEGWVVGNAFHSSLATTADQKDMLFVVTGIVEEKDDDSPYWHERLNSFDKGLLFAEEDYDYLLKSYCVQGVYYTDTVMVDYTDINSKNAELYKSYLKQFSKLDGNFENNFEDTLSRYEENKKTVSVITFTFELPIVALLLLFIYMISGQILEMETNEISMLKSRGVSRFKVILLYLLQSSVISGAGALIGVPIGYVFCKLAAGTDAFLVFTLKNTSIYKPVWDMLLFAALAFGLSMLFMTIPVVSLSKYTITERRTRKISSKSKALWEKYFLDIPLLGLSVYLLFNYLKQKETMSLEIISNGNVDPIVFLDSSLFILGCGLVALRLIHYIVRLIYKIGQKKWKPAQYVAFLQIIRSSRKQGFISVFLVMTIAMGIFNANLARSVNVNMEDRDRYNVGSDMIVTEKWDMHIMKMSDGSRAWEYKEPDYRRFDVAYDNGVESMTRVIRDDKTNIKVGTDTENNCLLLGINTKEFGETAELRDGLNDEHWFNYLNALALKPKGAIISSNLADKYEIKVGDTISYSRYSPISSKEEFATVKVEVVGIVDAFPGFESTVYTTKEDGSVSKRDNYLIVANYTTVTNSFRTRPYEIWMRLNDDTTCSQVVDALKNNNVDIKSFVDTESIVREDRDSTLIQITNGMFSVGFIISLIICGVGFLIYWILTIKERELIYGIYRAMGLSMKEIIGMLVTEQIFSSIFACVAGFGVGALTTKLFTGLISIVYLPRQHNLPIEVFFKAEDSMKMVIIVSAVLIVCFVVITRLIRNMNITRALKLGED